MKTWFQGHNSWGRLLRKQDDPRRRFIEAAQAGEASEDEVDRESEEPRVLSVANSVVAGPRRLVSFLSRHRHVVAVPNDVSGSDARLNSCCLSVELCCHGLKRRLSRIVPRQNRIGEAPTLLGFFAEIGSVVGHAPSVAQNLTVHNHTFGHSPYGRMFEQFSLEKFTLIRAFHGPFGAGTTGEGSFYGYA
jgi:hypothetical protein